MLAFALACCCLLPRALGEGLALDQKEQLVESIGQRLEHSAYTYGVDFSTWSERAEQHWDDIQSADTLDELRDVLQRALDSFGISHLGVGTPEDKRRERKGRRLGVGVAYREQADGYFLTYVIRDSPAWKAGLRKEDVIVSIGGEPLRVPEQFNGKLGETRDVSWTRGGETMYSSIHYESFGFADESSMRWLTDDVALIGIHSFQPRYYKYRKIARYFREAREAKAIIIDMRCNRGGLLYNSRHLASRITPSRSIFALSIGARQARRAGSADAPFEELVAVARKHRPTPAPPPYDGIVVILVDHASASGGDLFPASMQDQGRAVVIGQRTSGNLLMARHFQLPYGFRLYAPIAEILAPGGRRLESAGLHPDVPLGYRETANDETILRAAFEVIEAAARQPSPPE